ncbi:hypothetical protein AGABI1DRAFT_126352 [Agaricus bisporus var. burnettii JB137-S8]|uniref:Deacetylase sirtuin-type domain-containing protein n=1 Tax=Agaricus bisporus var. burnettii (strain JB137-S8 / ATCC MYA-4627 / FGSC 10392) TaxID=597362 RepID=K5XF27_AGABU|nr:uncharacterized protein AGABI1DRAFT_126352 [Agaricus bisporus var. burnettii JB137-S8]EKM82003.1 hypothetical protein AGABI1DRAFT_126352 [Agaricus bisporus var. burnettii JB137-S8]
MSQTREPSPSRENSPLSEDEDESLLALQIRAFLEASEDVDIDRETIEDLMRVLSDHQERKDSGTVDAEGISDDQTISQEDQPRSEEAEWTKQEVKQMLHHLKEYGSSSFIDKYVLERSIPITRLVKALGVSLCPELRTLRPQTLLYFLKVAMSHQVGFYNTIEDAVKLIQGSRRIMILTGAGISVSCGIPDFRSRDGLYASIKARGEYELDDPQQMFDIQYFKDDPAALGLSQCFSELCMISISATNDILPDNSSFASQIYPSNFIPSPCHRFIKCVEDKGKLLRNYTQNIDTLETLAGVRRVLQCHGSFATATCLQCHRKVPGTEIETEILSRKVPLCLVCNPSKAQPKKRKQTRKQAKGQWDSDADDESDAPAYPPGIMKPDITFFGEKLDDQFDHALIEDRNQVDLLIVIGTSLKVSPVAEIICKDSYIMRKYNLIPRDLDHIPHSVPQILINKTPIRHINPDIILLGDADAIILYLCEELGWEVPSPETNCAKATSSDSVDQSELLEVNHKKRPLTVSDIHKRPTQVGNSYVWLFDGAEGGTWVQDLERGSSCIQGSSCSSSGSAEDVATNGFNQREAKKPKIDH